MTSPGLARPKKLLSCNDSCFLERKRERSFGRASPSARAPGPPSQPGRAATDPDITGFFRFGSNRQRTAGHMKDVALIPHSETRFDSTAGMIEFHLDSSGWVTHFSLTGREGNARYDRTH